ncbi:MAG: M16 family metallopeptidase [Thermodesulforhabdaceae bacterium]
MDLKKKFCVSVLILFFLSIFWARDVLSTSTSFVDMLIPSKYPSEKFVKLKNGMTLLVRADDSTPVVSVYVLVRAGSIYEPPLSGLSHYLEHVVSGGSTKSFKEAEARKKIEEIGGASNAFTSSSRTIYYINTTKEHYREALDLLLSFVHECVFDPAEVEREKGVIMEEARMGENDVGRQLWYLFFETAYQKHPVRYPVIGRMDVFSRQTKDDLIRYYEKRYVPSNMVISVVGSVSPDDVIEYVAQKTSDWLDYPLEPAAFPDEPLPLTPRLAEKELPFVEQERAMIGFPTVTLSDPDAYALDVLATMLGEGKSSLLVRDLKEEKKLVSSISAFHWSPSFVRGQWIISLIPVPGKWQEVIDELKKVFSTLISEGISEDDLDAARRKIASQHIFERATASGQAMSLLVGFDETGDPYFDELYVEKIKAVTAEDVRLVVEKYIRWDLATIARVKPMKSPEEKRPATFERSQSNEPVVRNLENGLRVIIKEDHRLPMVAVELHGLGGQLLDSTQKPGVSHLTASLLTAGTENYTRSDIFRIIESRGGIINSGSGRNTYFVSTKVLSEDLPQAIEILSDIVTRATFPEEELEKKRQETILAIERTRENWQEELSIVFHEHFFKNHPYRFYPQGTKESVSRITRSDIIERYKEMVTPSRSVLAIFGDVNVEEALKLVSEKFLSWNRKSSPFPYPQKAELSPTGDSSVVVKTSKTAVGIMVGTGGLQMDDPKRAVLDVIDANISGIGYPGGRLQEALRGGTQSLVYVVHGFPFYGIKGGYFAVIAQTSPEYRNKVKGIIFQELQKTATSPISSQELETAKNVIKTMDALSLEDLTSQARDAALNEALGLGWNFRQKLRKSLDQVTPEAVQALAKELFTHTLTVETVPQDRGEDSE